ncbi:PQQ-dependent sugar dehydrogenase [uncultured Paraglaciecola sp.]|uniref:PQQ-dependent sugar dehydrogenase n=1 Tax=uncultured Paraglaciecola sp. TaxID=1765024 RepID=UPI0030D9B8B8|tara:strand:+ start:48586 stop:49716 length:1131 start_codon:yes stop_codon:yes gene_type:complete
MLKITPLLGFILSMTLTGTACAQQPNIPNSDSNQSYEYQLVTKGIDIPWGMAWLNATDILVTDRKGELRIIRNGELLSEKISGLPALRAEGQGGLLDVVVDPNYAQNQLIYFSYSGLEGEGEGAHTSVMRAKLQDFKLSQQKVIFGGGLNSTKGQHYGSRLTFDNQGYLYISNGDRGNRDVNPQRLDRDAGKIHRINSDGSIPKDNPFIAQKNTHPSIYSYGHRNPQGMAKHPQTGDIWTHEHGPKGGDEINIIQPGANYGWPVISYGVNYSGTSFTDLTEKEGMQQPAWYWVPSIAPSGMTFVTSDIYPDWKGKIIVGSLKFAYLVILELDGNKVVSQETLFPGIGRVRNVKQGADGYLYVATDGAGIFKIVASQ